MPLTLEALEARRGEIQALALRYGVGSGGSWFSALWPGERPVQKAIWTSWWSLSPAGPF